MTNVQRPRGGKVHQAASNGQPTCQPNGRVVHYGRNAGLITRYEQTSRPIDCLRCLALADSAVSA